MLEWPYYTLIAGRLHRDERVKVPGGYRMLPCKTASFSRAPRFANAAEAEAWLEAQDERGNVREG
jgi:hypothetical protein